MIDDSFFVPIESTTSTTVSGNSFIDFICLLEGWKTKCKNLHWAAPKKNIHVYLDEFLEVLSSYLDGLAEEEMGINGKMAPNAINGVACNVLNALDFINEVKVKTMDFYTKIPEGCEYAGIKSECETFIHDINKYKYLFSLCDVRAY